MDRRLLLDLLLAALVLGAGCTSPSGGIQGAAISSDAAPIQHIDEDDVESTSKPLENTQRSTLIVRVTDENEQPIPRAFVALIGQAGSGATNITGRLAFPDLAEGAYRIRIDAEHFTSAEANVSLAAAQEKEVTVVLEPLAGLVEGGTGHFHDYWSGQAELVVFQDAKWDITCYANQCRNAAGRGVRNFGFPEGATIVPGTGELELTAAWSGTSQAGVRLAMGGPGVAYTPTNHVFSKSGEKWRFPITAANTDAPHAQQSAWFVRMYEVATENTLYFQGPLVLSLKVFRGDYALPFDPPHPDEWRGRTQVRVVERSLHYGFACNHYPTTGEQSCQAAAAGGYNGPAEANFPTKVFMGTQKLEVRIKMNVTTAATAERPSFHYVARMPAQYSTGADVWVRAGAPAFESGTYKWTIPVTPAGWDPYYAKGSTWKYKVTLSDDRTEDTGVLIADMYLTIDSVRMPDA